MEAASAAGTAPAAGPFPPPAPQSQRRDGPQRRVVAGPPPVVAGSGVAARLDRTCPSSRADLDHALHGGEDYELLFTLPPRAKPPAALEGLPVTRIGTIETGRPGRVQFLGRPLEPLRIGPLPGQIE